MNNYPNLSKEFMKAKLSEHKKTKELFKLNLKFQNKIMMNNQREALNQ